MKLKCMIIDDEPNAVSLLKIMIGENTEWEILAACYDAPEAITILKTATPDFIFLDINMPKLSGMELAALLPADTKIVFTTAYSEYAAESYHFQTIDYLLKPITLKRFLAGAQKIESRFVAQVTDSEAIQLNDDGYFFVKSGKVIRKILPADLLYFEGEKEYVRLVTSKEQILIYRRLKDIAAQLPAQFARVHNSYIVNTKQIQKIENNHIYIGQKQIPVSEKFKDAFMLLIDKHSF